MPLPESFDTKGAPRSSFYIRGHHLDFFYHIWRFYHDPNQPETTEAEFYNSIEKTITHERKDYALDVFGSTIESKQTALDGLVRAAKAFCLQPDKTPVTIGPKHDLICASCAIGNHCGNYRISSLKDIQQQISDYRYTQDFVKFYIPQSQQRRVTPYEIEEIQEAGEFQTDLGTVRSAFEFMYKKEWDFHSINVGKYYGPPIEDLLIKQQD